MYNFYIFVLYGYLQMKVSPFLSALRKMFSLEVEDENDVDYLCDEIVQIHIGLFRGDS